MVAVGFLVDSRVGVAFSWFNERPGACTSAIVEACVRDLLCRNVDLVWPVPPGPLAPRVREGRLCTMAARAGTNKSRRMTTRPRAFGHWPRKGQPSSCERRSAKRGRGSLTTFKGHSYGGRWEHRCGVALKLCNRDHGGAFADSHGRTRVHFLSSANPAKAVSNSFAVNHRPRFMTPTRVRV